ncbi:hypothetical protein ACJX0J_016976, partial [Zea mays]
MSKAQRLGAKRNLENIEFFFITFKPKVIASNLNNVGIRLGRNDYENYRGLEDLQLWKKVGIMANILEWELKFPKVTTKTTPLLPNESFTHDIHREDMLGTKETCQFVGVVPHLKRLSNWKGKFLSSGGRLMLINSVLSSLPISMIFFWQGGHHNKKYRLLCLLNEDGLWQQILKNKYLGTKEILNSGDGQSTRAINKKALLVDVLTGDIPNL